MSAPSPALVLTPTLPSVTLVGSEPQPSVEERCIKRYGFHDNRLLLSINEKSGKVTIKPNAFNYRIILESMKELDVRFSVFEQSEMLNGQPVTDVQVKQMRERVIRLLGFNVNKSDVYDAVELIADSHKFNPVVSHILDRARFMRLFARRSESTPPSLSRRPTRPTDEAESREGKGMTLPRPWWLRSAW